MEMEITMVMVIMAVVVFAVVASPTTALDIELYRLTIALWTGLATG